MDWQSVSAELPCTLSRAVQAVEANIGRDVRGRLRLPLRRYNWTKLQSRTWSGEDKTYQVELPSLDGFFEANWQILDSLPEVRGLCTALAMLPYLNLPRDSSGWVHRESGLEQEAVKLGWDVAVPVLHSCIQHEIWGEPPEEYTPE